MKTLIKRLEAIEQKKTDPPVAIILHYLLDKTIKVNYKNKKLVFQTELECIKWKESENIDDRYILKVEYVNSPPQPV
jgi:hypothetical protein